MNILIRDVTEENVQEILQLSVEKDQTSFIETPQNCLHDAQECCYYRPVGLYLGKELVGFAMYGEFPEGDETEATRVWLDRYFIDHRYQGRGLGKQSLEDLIQHLVKQYKCNKIYLSVYKDNVKAIRIYQKRGFKFNGELDINGEKVMVKKLDFSGE
ncbi:GNAT family N-acetyltransferase [Brevibacillus ginsengisoli]|uniref:GNAT family N-acetyltransferase n=1 Tax=Brevibacillus ginsengisoli TaxID=363854 RepID=UPI003CECF2F6